MMVVQANYTPVIRRVNATGKIFPESSGHEKTPPLGWREDQRWFAARDFPSRQQGLFPAGKGGGQQPVRVAEQRDQAEGVRVGLAQRVQGGPAGRHIRHDLGEQQLVQLAGAGQVVEVQGLRQRERKIRVLQGGRQGFRLTQKLVDVGEGEAKELRRPVRFVHGEQERPFPAVELEFGDLRAMAPTETGHAVDQFGFRHFVFQPFGERHRRSPTV